MSALQTLLGLGLEDSAEAPTANRAFTLKGRVLEHPEFASGVRAIAHIHNRSLVSGVHEGLLLVGQTGSGKTTVLDYYVDRFPRKRLKTRLEVPVLKVATPEAPTVKSLAEAMLHALGDPAADKGTAMKKTERILHFVDQCGVQLILLDEFQHFYDSRRGAESRRVSDWLKLVMDRASKPVVVSGLPRSIAVLNANPQLRRRFRAPHYIKPFEISTLQQQTLLRGVLAQLQEMLPVSCISLSAPDTARRMYYATHGLMDYVIKILDDAVAHSHAGHEVGLQDLGAAFQRTIWEDVPEALNPFLAEKLRHLDQAREPFDVWDEPTQYTLSRRAARLVGGLQAKQDSKHAS